MCPKAHFQASALPYDLLRVHVIPEGNTFAHFLPRFSPVGACKIKLRSNIFQVSGPNSHLMYHHRIAGRAR